MTYLVILLHVVIANVVCTKISSPIVINTWGFENANSEVSRRWLKISVLAWKILSAGATALDSVQRGCQTCENEQCKFTVGYGGSPDENGETILDSMIMDGKTLNVGAVAGLRRIKSAAAVARKVLDHTQHSILVGDLATAFAKNFGFAEESLETEYSRGMVEEWRRNNCQPNFWINVTPDPKSTCGPYKPISVRDSQRENPNIGDFNHDTIGIIALDRDGNLSAGTSSNGAKFKIPGRVGDSPIPGAGCYADNEVGAAAATGDGDVMLRFLPSFLAVDEMRRGSTPQKAAETAINRIAAKYPDFSGAVIVLRNDGKFAAACHGMETFPYVVSSVDMGTVQLEAKCL